jgi:hypothetical protein
MAPSSDAASQPRVGVHFPLQPDGAVSTTRTGKAIWRAAALAVGDGALAAAIDAEREWRHKYPRQLVALAERMAGSREAHLAGAAAGLAAFEAAFELISADPSHPPANLHAAVRARVARGPSEAFKAVAVRAPAGAAPCVPAAALPGVNPLVLFARWTAYGVCEPSALDAARRVVGAAGATSGVLASHVFVCVGATSEMGPARTLLALGGTVVAIARPGARLQALIAYARGEGGGAPPSAGTLIVPVAAEGAAGFKVETDGAGCDLLEAPGEIGAWLAHLDAPGTADASTLPGAPAARRVLVVGNYGYLDGADHVRLTAAADALLVALAEARPLGLTAAAFLASPSVAMRIPAAAHAAAESAYGRAPLLSRACRAANARAPVGGAEAAYVCDGFATLQGPSYALAKTSQQWRAAVLAAGGRCARVSSLVAPGARTASMVHVATLAAALNGLEAFAPMHVPAVAHAAYAMALLLLDDLAQPQADFAAGGHARCAVHGGAWRCAFTAESIGWAAYAYGMLGYRAPPLPPA